MLDYFGEQRQGACGNCGNCQSEYVRQDITLESQKILSAVARVEKKFSHSLGITQIVRMLHGSRDQRILQLKLDALPTYGVMRDTDRSKIREYIDFLAVEGYLEISGDEYHVLRLGGQAQDVLFRGKQVTMPVFVRPTDDISTQKPAKRRDRILGAAPEDGLLTALKDLRKKLAKEAWLPAYIIFSNATLTDMAIKKPSTLQEFLEVSGVGEVKAERYGKEFLRVIGEYGE
jgi:ATP-dependent DNA helicase RecQ